MKTNPLTAPNVSIHISTWRKKLLRVHGALLLLVALVSAVYSTVARFMGIGVYGFLRQEPIVWTGLIQAYLLMAIIAGLIWLGAGQAQARKWDVVGAFAHVTPLAAVIFSWTVLHSAGLGPVAIGSLTFHTIWIVIETIAALYPDPAHT